MNEEGEECNGRDEPTERIHDLLELTWPPPELTSKFHFLWTDLGLNPVQDRAKL